MWTERNFLGERGVGGLSKERVRERVTRTSTPSQEERGSELRRQWDVMVNDSGATIHRCSDPTRGCRSFYTRGLSRNGDQGLGGVSVLVRDRK